MPAQAFTWRSFYERIKDVDPDLRQMALFDLQEELKKESFQLGNEEDQAVGKVLVSFTVEESNSEVHSNAVRLLEVLIPKASTRSRDRVVTHLASNMHQKPVDATVERLRSLRDNASLALKTCVGALKESQKETAIALAKALVPGLGHEDPKVRTEIFDVVAEAVKSFGKAVAEAHKPTAEAAMKDLTHANTMLRKRAATVLAAVATACDAELFAQIMTFTANGLETQKGANQRRYAQLVSSVSRAAGDRFAQWVLRIAPLLFKELSRLDALGEDDEEREAPETDDTRENILQALENIIARCPLHVGPIIADTIKHATALLSWDPNFCDDFGDDDDIPDEDDEDMDMEDDDDSSWKVRKSAARCLLTVGKVRPDAVSALIQALLTGDALLVKRFNERVENVRLEVLDLFRGLLTACRIRPSSNSVAAGGAGSTTGLGSFSLVGEEALRSEASGLQEIAVPVVQALLKAAKHKSPKIKQSVFVLLADLFTVMGKRLASAVDGCVTCTVSHLSDARLALPHLRPVVLDFARVFVHVMLKVAQATEDEAVLTTFSKLLPSVIKCTEERYYRTVVAALKVLHAFVAVTAVTDDKGKMADTIFMALNSRLAAGDADQEVRRAAMDGLAALLKECEAPLTALRPTDVKHAFDLIISLLRQESTRISAARAVTQIQRCDIDNAQVVAITTELSSFLRKNDRQVREQGLRALAGFIGVHSRTLPEASMTGILTDLVNPNVQLLSDKELFLTVLALQVAHGVVLAPKMAKPAMEKLAPAVIELLKSPLAQGAAVTEAGTTLGALARGGNAAAIFAQLAAAAPSCEAGALNNIAHAAGVVVSGETDAKKQASLIEDCAKMAASSDVKKVLTGVAMLGDVGRFTKLSATSGLKALEGVLASGSDDAKAAAAAALGRAASSPNGADVLESLIKAVAGNPADLLLRLRAMRECLLAMPVQAAAGNPTLDSNSEGLFASLVKHTSNDNESVVEAAAECVGRLAHAVPSIVATVKAQLPSLGEAPRAAVLSSIRFAMAQSVSGALDDAVRAQFPALLAYIKDTEPVKVRRAAVQLLTAAAYNRPMLVNTAEVRAGTYPELLKCTEVNKSLVEVVDLGPFKHTVDKGLDLRKQAFECVSVFADSLSRPDGVLEGTGHIADTVTRMVAALKDPETDYECWASARGTLVKLAAHTNGAPAILENADALSANLKTMVALKLKEGQEKERVDEAIRGAIVTALKINGLVPSIAQNEIFTDLMQVAAKSAHFQKASESLAE